MTSHYYIVRVTRGILKGDTFIKFTKEEAHDMVRFINHFYSGECTIEREKINHELEVI